MSDKKGIIFDMDGTVWDSSENVAGAWTVKVHEAGFTDKTITGEDIKSVMGKPMDVIADTLFTFTEKGKQRDDLRSACEKYENEFLRKNGGILYENVLETWAKLKEMGYHIYIVSNCQEGYIESFLGFYNIENQISSFLNLLQSMDIIYHPSPLGFSFRQSEDIQQC